jgi:hypothetical protein
VSCRAPWRGGAAMGGLRRVPRCEVLDASAAETAAAEPAAAETAAAPSTQVWVRTPSGRSLGVAVADGPGRLGALQRRSRFPPEVHSAWGVYVGAQGA